MSGLQHLEIPSPSLVLLIGPSGAGKSTFARRHFQETEIVSSDRCRALLCDDETDQAVTADAFGLVFSITAWRLKHYRLAVVDATSVKAEDRRGLLELARKAHLPAVAIVFDLPLADVQAQARARSTRQVPEGVIEMHHQQLQATLPDLSREGFARLHFLRSSEALERTHVVRVPLAPDARKQTGPFDLIGDVHGCFQELSQLLMKLGYRWPDAGERADGEDALGPTLAPPGRRALFLGDLVDRGPQVVEVLRLVMHMVAKDQALCLLGNHEAKLLKHLQGHPVKATHGLDATLKQLEATSPSFRATLRTFLEGLPHHLVLDGGRLVASHAGMKEALAGRDTSKIQAFALYGETTGESDAFGLPVRLNWAAEYRGRARVVYGHTPMLEPSWVNNTLCIDTGCVFGGALTALRYPELERISVPALKVWKEPTRPLVTSSGAEDIEQGAGLQTRFGLGWAGSRRAGQAARATWEKVTDNGHGGLPKSWPALPVGPVSAPASSRHGVLEHPLEALELYRRAGVQQVAVLTWRPSLPVLLSVCRNVAAGLERWGHGTPLALLAGPTGGVFSAEELRALGPKLVQVCNEVGLFEDHRADFLLLGGFLVAQGQVEDAWRRLEHLPLEASAQVRFQPLTLLASSRETFGSRSLEWHLRESGRLVSPERTFFLESRPRWVGLESPEECSELLERWERQASSGAEGIVLLPADALTASARRRVPPALLVRSPEALRRRYGSRYAEPETLARLREEDSSPSRGAATVQHALLWEGLERWVAREHPARIRACVLAALAASLEVEPTLAGHP